MAISLPSGFKISVTEPVDNRIVLSKAEMLEMKDAKMPDNYICICKDDGKLYIFNKTSVANKETGKFNLYEALIDLPKAISYNMKTHTDKVATEKAIASVLPGALNEALEDSTLGPELISNMFDNEQFDLNTDNKVELAINLIQAIDGN